jgi:hypothetical protein
MKEASMHEKQGAKEECVMPLLCNPDKGFSRD